MEPIIFAGTPKNAADTLRGLVAAGVPVALVITREDAPFGRKRELRASEVAMVAAELKLPVIKANRLGAEALTAVQSTGSRLALVVAYGALLKREAIDALELGWFNLHYSLLPRWRGASPVQSALLAGDRETGLTLFQIDEGVDTGRIAGSLSTVIEPNENAGRLLDRLTDLGISLALEQLPRIFAGIADLVSQSGEPTRAPKFTRADAQLSANESARVAANKVLAFNPEPVSWLAIGDLQLRVLSAVPSSISIATGRLGNVGGRVVAGFKGGSLELLEVQPSGKNAMSAADWWRGQKNDEMSFE
jgi:methionyl-tRNA formyltransferase